MKKLEDTEFLVLNTAHLNKMSKPEGIAAATGLDLDVVKHWIAAAEQSGIGVSAGEQFLLFPDGSSAVLDYYARKYGSLRDDPALIAWYDRFEVLNSQFIKLVSDWQKMDGDLGVEAKLIKVVERLCKAIDALVPQIPRYGEYTRRFFASIARVDQGDKGYLCNPTMDSIHNIWFEFHEDILSVLGRPRDTA